jgi:release factor glutamine methyltransferase
MSTSSSGSVRALLQAATGRLAAAGVASAESDAVALLAHAAGEPRGRVLLRDAVPPDVAERFEVLLARRETREPLQHLVGSTGFRYLELAVGPGVFVPRPETELLAGWAVEQALAVRAATGRDPVVVDLCTGSGAVALSVVTEVPGSRVHAVELDEQALAWAERNLAGSGVDLRAGDMASSFADLDGGVDVVVSNPPYIPLEAFESVTPEVRDHDPALALWSGEDGLDAMRVVEHVAARLLVPGGGVGAEHAEVQAHDAPAVFAATGRWSDVRDHEDLAGRARFVTARRATGPGPRPARLAD